MTHKQWSKLTPKEQIICVALEAGWNYPKEKDAAKNFPLLMCRPGSLLYARLTQSIPDYLNDLNAMHEAEKTLKGTKIGDYDSNLWIILKRDWEATNNPSAIISSWFATAAQKAEAFMWTTGIKNTLLENK